MFAEEPDYKSLRKNMVEFQLKPRGINDPEVLRVMGEVSRHLFVPEDSRANSYGDYPLSIGEGQTISQPYMVALMTQALKLTGNEKVLEVGTGSGYQAAVLSRLCSKVYTVEKVTSLVVKTKELFKQQGYNNISVKVGDGTEGWAEFSPYDRIMVTAGAPKIPEPLVKQLAEDGRMVIPVGNTFSQELILGEKADGKLMKKYICGCMFVPLLGKYGWKE